MPEPAKYERRTVNGTITGLKKGFTPNNRAFVSVTIDGIEGTAWEPDIQQNCELYQHLRVSAEYRRKDGSRYWGIDSINPVHEADAQAAKMDAGVIPDPTSMYRVSALRCAALIYQGQHTTDPAVIMALAREFELYLMGRDTDGVA